MKAAPSAIGEVKCYFKSPICDRAFARRPARQTKFLRYTSLFSSRHVTEFSRHRLQGRATNPIFGAIEVTM